MFTKLSPPPGPPTRAPTQPARAFYFKITLRPVSLLPSEIFAFPFLSPACAHLALLLRFTLSHAHTTPIIAVCIVTNVYLYYTPLHVLFNNTLPSSNRPSSRGSTIARASREPRESSVQCCFGLFFPTLFSLLQDEKKSAIIITVLYNFLSSVDPVVPFSVSAYLGRRLLRSRPVE